MMNRKLAIHVIEELLRAGVEEFILCPGARNAPLVQLISTSSLKHSYAYEERSGAFYALGIARRTDKPVAIIVTSGTAAAELLPATMEAYYTSVPLVLVTADRPRSHRGCNTPQAAEQVGLFGCYAPLAFDLEGDETFSLATWSKRSPLHLNVCFEDPAVDDLPYSFIQKARYPSSSLPEGDPEIVRRFFNDVRSPLVVVNALPKKDRPSVIKFLETLKAPVYLEGVSCLRNTPALKPYQVVHPKLEQHDAILRIGGVPTHRMWRDLEDVSLKVLSITEHPFSGLGGAPFVWTDIGSYLDQIEIEGEWEYDFEWQQFLGSSLLELFQEEPEAEPSFIHFLSKKIPPDSLVYLGNSLPIRTWDLASCSEEKSLEVQASRGLNGIDGQLSCFLGLCEEARENFAIVGDLTALYDFAAGWFDAPYSAIFVVNNKGGKIFSRRFKSPVFQHAHTLDFEHFAKFWKMDYQCWETIPENGNLSGFIELSPDPLATARFWQKWDALTKNVPRLCLK